MPDPADVGALPSHDLRGVLRVTAFRRLWINLSLCSLGDWLGLLATTALATTLTNTYRSHLYATGGVLAVRMAPALLFGPLAGAFADRFDRRLTMVVCDIARFALFATIPLVNSLTYLLAASFAVEIFSLFWIPAKEASVPNLVPRARLEAANQLSLVTTYGMAPVAALIFSLLALISRALGAGSSFFATNPNDLALWFDAGTFAFSAFTIWTLREISRAAPPQRTADGAARDSGLLRSIVEGWRFVGTTPLVRGLVVGILGAFASGGAVIATGRIFVADLGGGDAAYGVIFAAVFLGMALGMLLGPRALRLFSRRRLFGLAITGAGLALAVDSVLPTLGVAIVATLFVGALAGVAWVTGYTLLGAEVDDALRGRTWALVQSLVRLDLLAVLAVAPFVAGVIGKHEIGVARATVRFDGVTIILLGAGLVAAAVGTVAFRQMDDRRGVPLWRDLLASLRGRRYRPEPDYTGVMVAFEGGEGAGKTTQITLLAEWLRGQGLDVVLTHEPGATDVGRRLRQLLLDPASAISPRSEALLYAADRAAHVDGVILPALRRGAIVLTDRYVDSSIAYQGAGRALPTEEIAELSEWATGGLRPNLTVLLDIDPTEGLRRAGAAPDRIESESLDFHARVREAFRTLAARHPETYLVLDAAADPARVAARVRARVAALLPTLAGEATDEAGSGPAGGPPGTPEAGQSAADPATEILIPGER